MKKLFIIITIILLSGCTKANEVGENDIITAFFADYTEENFFEVSAEILDFKKSDNQKAHIKTAFGTTIQSAYANLMKNMENSPYLGHTGVLVLGDGLCLNGLKETVEFFSDINSISPNINVMLTEDSFSDFEPTLIFESAKKKILPSVPIYTLFIPSDSMNVIPVIKSEEGKPKKSGGVISDSLNFKHYIDEDLYTSYSLITNKFEDSFYKSFEILNSKCKVKNEDGTLKISLNLTLKNLINNENEKIKSDTISDLSEFLEEIKKNNLEEVLKKGDFQKSEIEVKIKVPDTGKLKER